jgi:hypothetical protein
MFELPEDPCADIAVILNAWPQMTIEEEGDHIVHLCLADAEFAKAGVVSRRHWASSTRPRVPVIVCVQTVHKIVLIHESRLQHEAGFVPCIDGEDSACPGYASVYLQLSIHDLQWQLDAMAGVRKRSGWLNVSC